MDGRDAAITNGLVATAAASESGSRPTRLVRPAKGIFGNHGSSRAAAELIKPDSPIVRKDKASAIVGAHPC